MIVKAFLWNLLNEFSRSLLFNLMYKSPILSNFVRKKYKYLFHGQSHNLFFDFASDCCITRTVLFDIADGHSKKQSCARDIRVVWRPSFSATVSIFALVVRNC